jgi:hypothetical protein
VSLCPTTTSLILHYNIISSNVTYHNLDVIFLRRSSFLLTHPVYQSHNLSLLSNLCFPLWLAHCHQIPTFTFTTPYTVSHKGVLGSSSSETMIPQLGYVKLVQHSQRYCYAYADLCSMPDHTIWLYWHCIKYFERVLKALLS